MGGAASRLRIGIDASNLRGGGGAVTHLAGILEAADPREEGITQVVVWSGSQTLAALPERAWLRKVDVPLLNRSLVHRLYWRRFSLPRLARESCDVILSPGGGLGKSSKPVVTMFRNMLPFQSNERRRYGWSWMALRLLLLWYVQMRAFRQAAGVIFLNEHARDTIMNFGGKFAGQSTVIPHGIDAAFRAAPRPQRAVSEYSGTTPFRLLYVSIVDVYKHQWNVAQAVADLRSRGVPVSLDLYGPRYEPAFQRLQRVLRRVDPNATFIRYHGPARRSELPLLYRSADAFVFASTCENMPNIVIEAMSAGLPIASSDRQPMPDVLGDDGAEFFDPESVSSVANALQRLCSDSARRSQLASRSFDRAQQYSWKRCAEATYQFVAATAAAGQL